MSHGPYFDPNILCVEDGCEEPATYTTLQLCTKHYKRRWKRENVLREKGPIPESLECRNCQKSFAPTGRTQVYCSKACSVAFNNRAWTAKLGGNRARTLWVNYRLTVEAYLALLERQGGVCGICGTDTPGYSNHESWSVDHDHACCPEARCCGKCVRGLLCHNCNMMIGHARDNPAILGAGIVYLERDPFEYPIRESACGASPVVGQLSDVGRCSPVSPNS